jgi:hypothetical protein
MYRQLELVGEQSLWKLLIATFVGVVTTSPQFGVIVFFLLTVDAIFTTWVHVKSLTVKSAIVVVEKILDNVYRFIQQTAVIFLMLLVTTSFSKFGELVLWIDVGAHIAIGFYLIGRIWTNGAKILSDEGFTTFVKKTIESWYKKVNE